MALMGTAEAAKRLGVTQARVNALIAAGRLKASKVGPNYVIEERALAAVKVRKPGRPPAKKK